MFGRRGVDAAARPEMFRRQRRLFRDRLRGGGARLLARHRRGLQGPEAGKPIAGQSRIRKTGEYNQPLQNSALLLLLL